MIFRVVANPSPSAVYKKKHKWAHRKGIDISPIQYNRWHIIVSRTYLSIRWAGLLVSSFWVRCLGVCMWNLKLSALLDFTHNFGMRAKGKCHSSKKTEVLELPDRQADEPIVVTGNAIVGQVKYNTSDSSRNLWRISLGWRSGRAGRPSGVWKLFRIYEL